MAQQKARSGHRNGLGIALVVALGHIHNVGSRPPGCRSWSGGCNELGRGCCRTQMKQRCRPVVIKFVGMLRTLARQYWRYVPPSFPGRNFQQIIIGRLSVGLSFFSPEISEITGFRWYIHASDFPPKSQHDEVLNLLNGLQVLHVESDVLKGYRFFWGAISVYSVSCMSNVIFNPSLLNWSSLILTVAHIYLHIYLHLYLQIYLSIYLSICPSIYLFIYLSIHLSIYLSKYPSIHRSIHPSIYLSTYLSTRSQEQLKSINLYAAHLAMMMSMIIDIDLE